MMVWLKLLSFLVLLQQVTLSSSRSTPPSRTEDAKIVCTVPAPTTSIASDPNDNLFLQDDDWLAPSPARGWEKPTTSTYKPTTTTTTSSGSATVQQKEKLRQTSHHHSTKPHQAHSNSRGQQQYVTEAVMKAREVARVCAKKRSGLLDQSQVAWFEGDKHEAKSLSNEGKEWGRKMDEANVKAAKMIIEPQRSMLTGELDLHGLYLKEALAATEVFLSFWLTQKRDKRPSVLIITGAGHHSKNKDQPVIRPKVVSLLREKKLKYSRVNKNGALRVSLPKRQ